ncbi:MAG: hypothetical protein ACJAW3_000428 [Lentimonas sp.]|jgi:hypothetical protein
MKKLLTLTSLAFLAASGSASAVTLTGNTASVDIIAPLAVSDNGGANNSLNFATVLRSDSVATTVTIDTTGSITAGSASVFGTPTAAVFNVTGEASTAYTISAIPGINLTGTGANIPLTFDVSAASGVTPSLSGAGTDTINIGGTIVAASGQTSGSYSGTYDVIVNY